MSGYIELKDDNGTYRITREEMPVALGAVIEGLVIPLLIASGYSSELVNEYLNPDQETREDR